MPIQECRLPGGGFGWQWGAHGKCYGSRADAVKQGEAARANGYVGDRMALDKTMRSVDTDGRMRVELSNISKAMVCPYLGNEIPGATGLDPDKVYYLLRDPEELKKAAPTFRELPVLIQHTPVSADDPRRDLIVGATGSEVEFIDPYLVASLSIWDAQAIAGIESGDQTEISAAYHYTPDMTPGEFDGVRYDGVMRNIEGNHIALVDTGRAGPDVVVADRDPFTKTEHETMKASRKAVAIKAALGAYLRPKLAQDAAIGDLGALVRGVKAATLAKDKTRIVKAVRTKFDGKLAQDIDLDPGELAQIIEMAAGGEDDDDAQDEDKSGDDWEDDPDHPGERRKKAVAADADDDDDEDKDTAEDEDDHPPKTADTPKPPEVTKQAMDAAIAKAVASAVKQTKRDMEALSAARRDVAPMVGDVALDSAEAVYKFALERADIDIEGVHPSAYRAMVKMHKTESVRPTLGMDAATAKAAAIQFPGLARFTH